MDLLSRAGRMCVRMRGSKGVKGSELEQNSNSFER